MEDPARRTIPGPPSAGAGASDVVAHEIRGSTTILELLRMFPDGRAAKLMGEIQFPCAHCGGALREPLTLAATRHARDPRAVLDAFRALRATGRAESSSSGRASGVLEGPLYIRVVRCSAVVVAAGKQIWVGRSLERVEDEALLRGEGRFIDDLEPVPHAWHAAIVRSSSPTRASRSTLRR